jgi:hypothetical protein
MKNSYTSLAVFEHHQSTLLLHRHFNMACSICCYSWWGHFAFFLENTKDVMGRYGQFSQLEQIPPTLNYSVAVNFDWVVLQ